jgi:hypothetical protein
MLTIEPAESPAGAGLIFFSLAGRFFGPARSRDISKPLLFNPIAEM